MTDGTPIEFPAATYFRVVARFGRLIADGADPDEHPDRLTQGGEVTLSIDTPDKLVKVREADGFWRLDEVADRKYVVQSTGELLNPVSGEVGVWLVDTSNPNVDPLGATYSALLRTASGRERRLSFNQDSAAGGVVDLVAAVGMSPSAGVSQLDGRVQGLEARVAVLEGAGPASAPDATTPQTINSQTGTAYTLAAADAGKLVTLTNEAAITLTIPANVFTTGQRVDCSQRGEGAVTVVGSGVTLRPMPGMTLVSEGQYAAWSVYFHSATEADVIGWMAPA